MHAGNFNIVIIMTGQSCMQLQMKEVWLLSNYGHVMWDLGHTPNIRCLVLLHATMRKLGDYFGG